jgi:hypothetical protein
MKISFTFFILFLAIKSIASPPIRLICRHENTKRVFKRVILKHNSRQTNKRLKKSGITIIQKDSVNLIAYEKFKFYKTDSISFNLNFNFKDNTLELNHLCLFSEKYKTLCDAARSKDEVYTELLNYFFNKEIDNIIDVFGIEEKWKLSDEKIYPQLSLSEIETVKIEYVNINCIDISDYKLGDTCVKSLRSSNISNNKKLIKFINNNSYTDNSWCFVPDMRIYFCNLSGDTLYNLEYVSSCGIFLINHDKEKINGGFIVNKNIKRYCKKLTRIGLPSYFLEGVQFVIDDEKRYMKEDRKIYNKKYYKKQKEQFNSLLETYYN